jgi:hypothetical protein
MSWQAWLTKMRIEMDTNTEFELFPYVGVGPLKFGMSPAQVERLLGAPDKYCLDDDGDREEHRGYTTIGYSKNGDYKLNHIGFDREMVGLRYGDLKIFSEPYDMLQQHHVLRTLCAEDGAPRFSLGFVILFNLGFAMTGFQDKEEDDLTFVAFPKGGWDFVLDYPETKPFKF